ncbi:MAG: hypothetical protein COC22_00235 [Flavobacteriaceae bacterium]|nr:MAG: hypothetical protein COC22_00235 [Flavobacteriaceae bacterium]
MKELAKRAKLKVAFKDISNDKLLNASKSAKSVEGLFSGHIKPTRIAAMKKNRSNEKGNER